MKMTFLTLVVCGGILMSARASAETLYSNDFNQNGATGTNTDLSVAGWTGTTEEDGLSRVYQLSGANWAVWSYNYTTEAFYTAPGVLTLPQPVLGMLAWPA